MVLDVETLVAQRRRAVRNLLRRLVRTSERATKARAQLLAEMHAELQRLGEHMEPPPPLGPTEIVVAARAATDELAPLRAYPVADTGDGSGGMRKSA